MAAPIVPAAGETHHRETEGEDQGRGDDRYQELVPAGPPIAIAPAPITIVASASYEVIPPPFLLHI